MAIFWDETDDLIYNLPPPQGTTFPLDGYYAEACWIKPSASTRWSDQFKRWRYQPYTEPFSKPTWSRFLPPDEAAHLAHALIFTTNGGCPDCIVGWSQNNDTGHVRIAVVQAVVTLYDPTDPPEWAIGTWFKREKPRPAKRKRKVISRFDIINGDD